MEKSSAGQIKRGNQWLPPKFDYVPARHVPVKVNGNLSQASIFVKTYSKSSEAHPVSDLTRRGWTQRDLNPHLDLDRDALLPLHHTPV